MYTLLPIYQDKFPESFFFETVEDAIEGGTLDFNDPHTPDAKGFIVCEVGEVVTVDRTLNHETQIEDLIAYAPVEEVVLDEPEDV